MQPILPNAVLPQSELLPYPANQYLSALIPRTGVNLTFSYEGKQNFLERLGQDVREVARALHGGVGLTPISVRVDRTSWDGTNTITVRPSDMFSDHHAWIAYNLFVRSIGEYLVKVVDHLNRPCYTPQEVDEFIQDALIHLYGYSSVPEWTQAWSPQVVPRFFNQFNIYGLHPSNHILEQPFEPFVSYPTRDEFLVGTPNVNRIRFPVNPGAFNNSQEVMNDISRRHEAWAEQWGVINNVFQQDVPWPLTLTHLHERNLDMVALRTAHEQQD